MEIGSVFANVFKHILA